jgi:transposase
MSLLSPLAYVIPNDTVCVARAAFPTGNVYMQMHDARGPISTNPQFAALFSHTGQPAADPARLALILVMQFASWTAKPLTTFEDASIGRMPRC